MFDLRDKRSVAIEEFILAEAELQGNMQINANKEFVEIKDLEISYKLLKPVLKLKEELQKINEAFEEKKSVFITLLEASGCGKLECSNLEFNEVGKSNIINYIISVSKNIEGKVDLSIQPQDTTTKP